MVLRNVGILLHYYTVSQPRRSRNEKSRDLRYSPNIYDNQIMEDKYGFIYTRIRHRRWNRDTNLAKSTKMRHLVTLLSFLSGPSPSNILEKKSSLTDVR
jgi:hypothetical protein